MKNCEPLVSFPRLAMDKRKALSCFRVKFSSVRREDITVLKWILWEHRMEILLKIKVTFLVSHQHDLLFRQNCLTKFTLELIALEFPFKAQTTWRDNVKN